MCKNLVILLFCAVLFCATKVFAQQKTEYVFRHIYQSDGLLNTVVTSIVQDNKGYLWILTPGGLQRYDGSRFVNYPNDLNNPDIIKDTRDALLFADKKNNCLWITNNEFEKLDLNKNKFSLYNSGKILKDSNFKFNRYTDVAGAAILVSDFGLHQYDKTGTKIITIHSSAPLLAPGSSNIFIVDKKNGENWISSWDGLTLYYNKTKAVYTHNYNPINHPLLQLMDKNELTAMLIDSKQNYWIGTGGPFFYRYNARSQKMVTYSLTGMATAAANIMNQQKGVLKANCFFEDNHHQIWIGTSNGGLLLYNAGQDVFTTTLSDNKNKQGLHYNYEIYCIFQDREENMWIGSDKGINIFSPYRQYFQTIQHQENNPSSIPKNEIMNCIQAANGDIIAGTWGGGITVYDSKWNFKKNISLPNPYEYNMVWSFAQNDDGLIWMGCQHGYIHLYNPATGTIKTIHPPELNNSTIWCMAKDSRGNIWMGLHNGKIAGWDKKQNKFYAYNDSARGIQQLYGQVFYIFFDSRQRCWVSTRYGFKKFDTGKRLYTAVYTPNKQNAKAISANTIEGIEEYNDSTLLIGTLYGGLNFFNTSSKTFTHLTASDGLPTNTVHAIKKDAAGYVWFTTDYDLYKFMPADKKFIRLNMDPGMLNSEFKTKSFYPLQNERWLAGTSTEIISFYTKNSFSKNNTDAKVEITGFKVFDKTLSIDSLLFTNRPVNLSYQQNFLTIEFALLNFSNPQQTNYYYRLDDVDKDWVSAGTKNIASYTNLQPGKYIFSVRAGDGNDSTEVTCFSIIITPPFWKTLLFKITVLAAACLLVFWLFKKRIKTIRHEAALKQKIAETETKALRAQMNPHFIFNCLTSIDNLIQMDEKEKATLYLSKFAKLIRSILESSASNAVPCWKDLETLQLYLQLEALRWDNKFSYSLNISEEILNGDYKVPPLIIQPFVENAIHHGLLNKIEACKKLTLDVFVLGNSIHYIIEDNGVGRIKAAAYKQLNKPAYPSMGMQITTDRIHLFNQESNNGSVKITDLYNADNHASGTRVEVELIIQS